MGSQWEDKKKDHLNIVFVGHVDHGKSTTVGRLLLDSGHIEQHVIDKNEKLASEQGKAGFGLAYVMDGLKEERERGIARLVGFAQWGIAGLLVFGSALGLLYWSWANYG